MNASRVLIVEDEFVVAKDIEARLLDMGYVVSGKTDSGAAALEFAESLSPDVVLMDIHLSGSMDGITAATEIRRRFQLPVIFLTAFGDDSTLERAKKAEPFGYVLKPFEDRELRTNIEIAVYRSKSELEITRMTRLFSALSQVNQAIARIRSQEHLLPAICQALLELGQFKGTWIGRLDTATGTLVPIAKVGEDPGVTTGQAIGECGCALGALQSGESCVVNELQTDARTSVCRNLAVNAGIRGCGAFPIRLHGRMWGMLVAGTSEAGFFNAGEQRVIEEMATDVSFALEMLETEGQRQQAVGKLKEREQRLANILHTALDGFWIVDSSGTLLEVNDAYCLMSGYSREELLQLNIRDIEYDSGEEASFDQMFSSRQARARSLETSHRRKDGKPIYVETSITYHDFDGGRFVCFIRDITARKRAAEELRKSEERFSKAFRSSPLAIAISTFTEGRFLDVNEAFLQMFHYRREEVIGRTYLELGTWEAQLRAEMRGKLERAGRLSGYRAQFKTSAGEIRAAEVSAELIDVDGVRCILSVILDVTDAQRLESQLRQSQKLEAVGTLAGGIAHDFNNILLAINGNATLAMAELPSGHPARKSNAEILKAAARASELVKRLLTFSRPQGHEKAIVQLAPVIDEALHLMRATLPSRVQIHTDFAQGLLCVEVNPGQIHQVIVNLATNAGHAIGDKSGAIKVGLDAVTITSRNADAASNLQPGCYVRLTFADDGCGMDSTTLARIFDPFFTTKKPGQGTGLGLSVVHGIVTNSDGAISVSSQLGKGTSFQLFFPARQAVSEEQSELPQNAAVGHSGRILYLDDEEDLVTVVTHLLQRRGYRVAGFTDGEAALGIFSQRPSEFDAVITDLSMPRISGLEFAEGIRAIRSDIPIVLMSGYLREQDEEQASRLNIQATVLKSNSVDKLVSTLTQTLAYKPELA